MDIGKSFNFVFEDESWVGKILIGGIVSVIPIAGLATVGYALRTLKNVAAGDERPLPEWSDFGDLFVKGLLATVAGLIYSLPALVFTIPLTVFSNLGGSAGAISGGSDGSNATIALCLSALSCIGTFYSLLVSLWLPAAMIKYAVTDEFAAFFSFGEIWNIIASNLGNYIVAILVAIVVGLLALVVGAVFCLVGILFTMFWADLVYFHLLGQVAREGGEATAGVPAPVI